MSDPTPMAARHAATLAELAELGMALARKLQARALAAETAEEERAAGLAFHRISRSVRQTLALEAQLERLRARMLREALKDDEARGKQAIEKRKAQIRPVLARLVWKEHEGDEADAAIEHLDELLAEDGLADDFLDIPIEDHIARLRADLELRPAEGEGEATPPTVIPRSGDTPDPGDPEGAARSSHPSRLSEHPPQLGSPASPCGRAEDDGGKDDAGGSPWAGTWSDSS